MQSVLKRAFELVPECGTMFELKKRLKAQGFENLDAHLGGLGTKRQLRTRFNQAEGVRSMWHRGNQ